MWGLPSMAMATAAAWLTRRCVRYTQAVAKILPEADALLGAGFHEPEERIAAIAPQIGAGAGGDFTPGHLAADIVFRAVGVQRVLGPLQHRQQLFFLGAGPRQQPGERGKARSGGKDAIEAALELARTARGWCEPVSF